MVVPRARLLFWVAAVALPCAFVAAARPGATVICIAFAGIFGVIALTDALLAGRSLDGIQIELPAVTRMSKGRGTAIEVRIQNEPGRQRRLRLALGLPPAIIAPLEEMEIVLPANLPWSRLAWNCTPARRGKYSIPSVYLEGVSSLGFWSARRTQPLHAEIRVYPNLLLERRSLAAMFLDPGRFGVHAERQVGKGRDFEKLRDYASGDSFDEIDWKATARRGKPITRVFQVERTQEVYVAIDTARLSSRQPVSSEGDAILERFVTAALTIGLAAEQQGDLFGLLTFAERVETFVRAKNGKTHYGICRDALYTLQPRIVTPDFDEVCTFIRLRLRRRSLIVFLTSLDDPALAESFVRNVDLIRRQHLVIVGMIRQPWTVPLFADPKVESTDDLYRQLGGHLQWQRLRRLEKTLHRIGVRFSLIEHERLAVDLVSQYVAVKQRQLL